jgi:hypothetical protein
LNFTHARFAIEQLRAQFVCILLVVAAVKPSRIKIYGGST